MISEILAELRGKPPDTWAPALREHFPDDAELVAQALLWLHAAGAQAWDHDATPVLGDDRYELGLMLDAGATAAVWQAYDRKLRRDVAIKLFRSEPPASSRTAGSEREELDEILAEARAACEVQSDHVVRVLDVHAGDPAYIVMELVGEYDPHGARLAPGASAQVLRPRDLDEAVRWVRDVARGVHDAHLRNVFHRDLKPHNVLITPFSRRARISDFGLAITGGAVARGAVRLAGTPEYIAPEQARGLPSALDPHDVDERATLVGIDVWGIGALAFELCGGEPPWRVRDGLEPWEVAAAATEAPAIAVGTPRLRRVIGKAMAIDRGARYASAGELGDELDAYLARRPTSLDRKPLVRFALWCRRNPQLTVTALLAVVLAALTLVAYGTIVLVRGERNHLADEMSEARIANEELAERAKRTRHELADTEASLGLQNTALATLKATLADAQKDYDIIVAAKEHALRDADAATKQLAEQLASARADRDAAQLGRAMYEGFWTRARGEADQLAHDRDEAVHERDAARGERDQDAKDRDAARAALAKAEADRDAARDARDRAEAMRRRSEAELARLLSDFAASDAGVPSTPRDATADSAAADAVLTPRD